MGFSHRYFLIIFAVFLASCSPSHEESTELGSNLGSITLNPNPDPALEAAAISVFNSTCIACHNGSQVPDLRASAIDDIKENSLYVNIGSGDTSTLFVRMTSSGAPMPPTGGSSTDAEKIKAWIDDLGIVEGEGGGGDVNAATFTDIETTILAPKCYSCHDTQAPVFQDYASVLNLIVIPNNLESALYTVVTEGSSVSGLLMPRGGQAALTTPELEALESWIMNGAPNN